MQKSKLMNALVAIFLMSGMAMSAFAVNQAAAAGAAADSAMAANTASSDDAITSSAKAALSADAQSATLPINITTKKGVVMLSGEVPSPEAGDRVIQIVASVDGVKEVKNDMRVKTAG
ncbi:MAG TPA: BON domain-containing protein [Janthinobacterium sp.]|jgi:hyperosmotically inducible protein|nr:BON domain-containing protein [Janthinobacterium sp.]